MEVWKILFLSKWVICRFHVNLPGCRVSCCPWSPEKNNSGVHSLHPCIPQHPLWQHPPHEGMRWEHPAAHDALASWVLVFQQRWQKKISPMHVKQVIFLGEGNLQVTNQIFLCKQKKAQHVSTNGFISCMIRWKQGEYGRNSSSKYYSNRPENLCQFGLRFRTKLATTITCQITQVKAPDLEKKSSNKKHTNKTPKQLGPWKMSPKEDDFFQFPFWKHQPPKVGGFFFPHMMRKYREVPPTAHEAGLIWASPPNCQQKSRGFLKNHLRFWTSFWISIPEKPWFFSMSVEVCRQHETGSLKMLRDQSLSLTLLISWLVVFGCKCSRNFKKKNGRNPPNRKKNLGGLKTTNSFRQIDL